MSRSKRLREFRPEKASAKRSYTTELSISSLGHDGRGIGRHEGKVVFVDNALPGELVLVQVQKVGRRFDEGVAREHRVISEHRCDPVCRHYSQCGGCQLQHLVYDQQLKYKVDRLAGLLHALGAGDVTPVVLSGPHWHYRHRVRLAFAHSKNGLLLGFREGGSHRVVSLKTCPVLQAPLLDAVLAAKESLAEFLTPLKSGEVVFSLGKNDAVGLSVYSEKTATQKACAAISTRLAELGQALFRVYRGKTLVWHNEQAAALRYECEAGLAFEPGDFTQATPEINSLMLEAAMEWLDLKSGDRVADYFCGLGNFSIPMARTGAVVVGYEADIAMVQRARQSAAQAGLNELFFHAVDLFKEAPELDERVNKVLLDPPRAGARALCQKLASCNQVRQLVYVSCDPASLEKDVRLLQDGGFVIQKAALADMFPQTRHMESLILMNR